MQIISLKLDTAKIAPEHLVRGKPPTMNVTKDAPGLYSIQIKTKEPIVVRVLLNPSDPRDDGARLTEALEQVLGPES